MIDRRQTVRFTRRVLSLARAEQLTLLSAAVAFYAFLSFVPLMLLALGIAASLGGEALAEQVTDAVGDVLTASAQQVLADTLVDETSRQGATVVGALGVIWGSSRVLRGLDRAFSEVYGTAASKSFLDTVWDSAIVFLAITAGLALVAALELAIQFAPFFGIGLVAPVLVLVGLAAAFLPMYVVFPDAGVAVREAVPGTIIASVGWLVLGRTFSIYAALAGGLAIYGALGAVFLVLVWLYAGAAILVFGAVVNAVLADVDVDRQLQSPGPRQVSTEAMSEDATGTDDGETGARAGAHATTSARTRDRADDPAALREEIRRLEERVESYEESVERRTVRKESLENELEQDLKRYVRRRVRRSHARGWGPYLVLLYGTAMTVAAFYFLDGIWAILSMFVLWTSTLGVYVLMVLFGAGLSLLDVPGRVRDMISERRS